MLLQQLEVVRDILSAPGMAGRRPAHLPEERFPPGPVFQAQIPEIEERKQLLLQLDRIVIGLTVIFGGELAEQFGEGENDLWELCLRLAIFEGLGRVDRADDVQDQQGVMGHHRTAAL